MFQKGTFVNAFYESWPIVYGEEAYGFAKTGQTIVNVTDSQVIKLYVDDEPFYLPTASLLQYERRLDMQAGTLDREVLWETPSGKHVSIHSRRLVSFPERHLAAISYEVTVLNAKVSVVIVSEIGTAQSGEAGSGDPRQARGFQWQVLQPRVQAVNDRRIKKGLSATWVAEVSARYGIRLDFFGIGSPSATSATWVAEVSDPGAGAPRS